MKAIEVWCNGEKLATAWLTNGSVTATLVLPNQIDPILFFVRGRDRSTGAHADWMHRINQVGDELVLRSVDVDEQPAV